MVEIDGRAVGIAAGGDGSFTGAAVLTSLWVEPEARGRGVGDLLVTTVAVWASRAGYAELYLWVTEGNHHAERLYERNGFARTGAVMQDARPEFEMGRRLLRP